MESKVYIKLIDITHREMENFFDELKQKYGVSITLNKDTYSLIDKQTGIYQEIMEKKNEFGRQGKLIMVYKGGL